MRTLISPRSRTATCRTMTLGRRGKSPAQGRALANGIVPARRSVGDAAGELGESLLIDRRPVPVVPYAEIALARTIAAARAPAMAAQEISGRGENVGARVDEVATAIAVEVDGKLQIFRRQELRLPKLT